MREAEVKMLYDGITSVRDEYVEEAQRVKLKRSHLRWRKWAVLAACFCLFLAGSFHVLDRLGYFSMGGYKTFPVTIVNGTYYYMVRHDGLYAYTPGGQSKRLLGTYWYDGCSVNEYGIYYTRGRSLYVLPHGTKKSQKLYTSSLSESTHISFSFVGDGNIVLTTYNKHTDLQWKILLDGGTGDVLETLTEPTPYREAATTSFFSVYSVGNRTIHLVGVDNESYRADIQENGVSILPDGYSVSHYSVRLGDSLVFQANDANHPDSNPIAIIRSDGNDTFLPLNKYVVIQDGTADGRYLFYIFYNECVMCMDAYTGEKWKLTADADFNFADLETDGEYLYTCAPWKDIQTCWKIGYDEDGRPVELQLVAENIIEQ